MSWKTYKNKIENQGLSETDFILGIDIGNSTTAISALDSNRLLPEVIDFSGGYGKQSVPTVIQYMPDTKEWVFGEYALLNRGFGTEITVSSIIEKLGIREYIDIDKKPVSYTSILTYFVKEIISGCYAINPKAEIAGIVLAVPEHLSEEAKDELKLVFNTSGYGKSVIEFATDKECILNYHYFNKEADDEKLLILDFGSREVRGSIYQVSAAQNEVHSKSLSYLFDQEISTGLIDNRIEELFTDYYLEENKISIDKLTKQTKDLISAFSYQHKDLIFQKSIESRPIKLYFNFAYPPFQKSLSKDDLEGLIAPYRLRFNSFISELISKTPNLNKRDISTIICTGGGFEMLWVREEVQRIFRTNKVSISKYSKGVIADGACIIAGNRLGVLKTNKFTIEDNNKINVDIGLKIGKQNKFTPIIERNSFWWQKQDEKILIINDEIEEQPIELELFWRDRLGEVLLLDKLKLPIPKRPKGATRISVNLQFNDYNKLVATVKDFGFGELFAASNYEETFEVNTCELGRL